MPTANPMLLPGVKVRLDLVGGRHMLAFLAQKKRADDDYCLVAGDSCPIKLIIRFESRAVGGCEMKLSSVQL
jgi:hypothetical protein